MDLTEKNILGGNSAMGIGIANRALKTAGPKVL
jgi:hypothetical protein